jgi:hypothetical protein
MSDQFDAAAHGLLEALRSMVSRFDCPGPHMDVLSRQVIDRAKSADAEFCNATTSRQEPTMSKTATKPMSILEQLRKASADPSNWDVVGIMNDAHDEIARLRNVVQIFELANVHQFDDENGETWFSARGISQQTGGVRYKSMWEAIAAVRRLHCLPVEATE